MNRKNYILLIITLLILICPVYSSESSTGNDILYSDEYFDYLIECANNQIMEEKEKLKQQEELQLDLSDDNETDTETTFQLNDDNQESNEIIEDEISMFEDDPVDIFKLHVSQTAKADPYKESFQIDDHKSSIPVNSKFSFIQDTMKIRNRYSSDDYRILAGVELKLFKHVNLASGFETNYRGYDQNPTSRKIYVTPYINITDKVSLGFHNKYNINTKSTDHDLGLKISPFKSKAADFGVYAGLTKQVTGEVSESINFSTNFYFY